MFIGDSKQEAVDFLIKKSVTAYGKRENKVCIWILNYHPENKFKTQLFHWKRNWDIINCNKTGTSNVGAISKVQKAQKNFWKKIEIFEKFFSFEKKSHSAEKCKRGILLDLLKYIPLQNIKKLEGGTLWGQKNFRKKVAQCRKKLKGGTL